MLQSNFDFCKKKNNDLTNKLENQKFGYKVLLGAIIDYLEHQMTKLYKKNETLRAGLFEDTVALHDKVIY